MPITIIQGNDHSLQSADINVVIDVIRAFTVAHYAFMNGAEQIMLVGTTEEAFRLKQQHAEYLLMGEVRGLPIEGFEFDNSPSRIARCDLAGRTLVQKTTNGVKATLHSLNADFIYVTGFSNARTTGKFIHDHHQYDEQSRNIHLIASHPTGDEDLACAQFLKGIIEGHPTISSDEVVQRIVNSHAAQKFFNPDLPEFDKEDISFCIREVESDFVMRVNKLKEIPTIERVNI